MYVAICLTREPLFKRNLTNFGPTNLRATLCYNLVRLAAPQCGEVLVDPMCGGATIPMEVSLHKWDSSYDFVSLLFHSDLHPYCPKLINMIG